MSLHIVEHTKTSEKQLPARHLTTWQKVLFYALTLTLFAVALWLRLHTLDLPFDRDSYDEGVYWQSLRTLSAGHPLYQQTFDSQPPFFLLAILPIYLLFGQTIWSARLGIALLSLLGLLGAFLLGKALRGHTGALVALLLLVSVPFYLSGSQILQAEAPSTALSLLAVGLAYLWWNQPAGRTGLCLAALTSSVLALAILTKLLVVSALVPIGLLALAQLWRIFHLPAPQRLSPTRSLLAGCVAFILTTGLVLLPFTGTFSQLWDTVVTFHDVAGMLLVATRSGNLAQLKQFLTMPITYLALYTTIVALLKRDWRIIPLLAWFLTTAFILWRQTPLFQHHLIVLLPPLVGLVIMGLDPIRLARQRILAPNNLTAMLTVVLVLLVVTINIQGIQSHYRAVQAQGQAAGTQFALHVAHDLQQVTQPDQLVITDAQFLVALANRNTPPELVDTSTVRLTTGYVTNQQLVQAASQTRVQAVLFYTNRLIKQADFQRWVSQHYHLVHDYGNHRQLWVKIERGGNKHGKEEENF